MRANRPFELRPVVERFMQQRGAGPAGLARYMPEPWAKVIECITNVLSKVERDGGQAVFGWTFMPRFSPDHGCYVVATHHAVWHSPTDLALVDVTPFHPEERHRPSCSGGDTIFLVDESALPHRRGRVLSPLPLCFLPVAPEPALDTYLQLLAREEETRWAEQLNSLLNRLSPNGETYR